MTFRELLPLAIVIGCALKKPEDLRYLWRKPTDWDAVRVYLGYEPQPARPLPAPKHEWRAYRYAWGFWPVLDYEAERRRLGYDH